MRCEESRTGSEGTASAATFPARRRLVALARRALWDLVQERARRASLARCVLRRRLGDFLRGTTAGRLVAILRSSALAGAVAAALAAPGSAQAQEVEFPAIELADIARGEGGFQVSNEGEPAPGEGVEVAAAGDVNGDGLADLLVGASGADPEGRENAGESYVVFGKPSGERVDLRDIQTGLGGFAIRGSADGSHAGLSVAGAGDVNGDGLADLLVAARHPGVPLSGMTFVVFGKAGGGAPPRFRRGGVNGTAALDISDATRLLGYLFLGEAEPPCLDAADADDSGRLDVSDAVKVLRYLFLDGDAPPAPGPLDCGGDPTADEIACTTPTEGCER